MKTIVSILLVLGLLVFVGCDSSQQAPPTQQQDQQVQQPTQEQLPKEQPKQEQESSSFDIFAKANKEATYKVTYDFSSSAGQSTSGTMMMAHKADNRKIATQMSQGNSEMYILGDAFYTCSDAQGSMQCFKLATTQDTGFETMDEAADNPDDYKVEKLATRTIAGAKAQCFRITSLKEDAVSEVCYESHGVPLYVKTTGSSEGTSYESTMEAKSFSLSVSDSEFELPAEPQDMEEMMKNMGQGMPDISDYQ